jgi:hypothetical protein
MDQRLQEFIDNQISLLKKDNSKHGIIIEPDDNSFGVLLWDPITQNSETLNCPVHDLELVVTEMWTSKEKIERPPRQLYHLGRNCLLVSRLYKCSQCNELYKAHNESLSSQLMHTPVPFTLFHRSGCTTKCFDLIVKMIETGEELCLRFICPDVNFVPVYPFFKLKY